MTEERKFTSYTHGETRDALGRGVRFSCAPEDKDEVAKFLRDKVRSVDTFVTRSTVSHGSYGGRSRYEIKQHKYIAGQCEDSGEYRFIEVLEIMDAPDGRHPFVIHDQSSYQASSFSEWRSIEEAVAAHQIAWKCREQQPLFMHEQETDMWAPIRSLSGFMRVVRCGKLNPWFYAIGEELLVGDYTFPDGFQDDPVFRFGAKFVVFNSEGFPSLKTCMGTRFVPYEYDGYADKARQKTRIVHWDDGTCWDEAKMTSRTPPRPAQDGEMWISGAMDQFRALLAGQRTSFEIKFADGQVLKTKLMRGDAPALGSPEGKYQVSVFVEGRSPREVKVDFKPSKRFPTVREWVAYQLERQSEEFDSFEVSLLEQTEDGQHWSGVFLAPPKHKKV